MDMDLKQQAELKLRGPISDEEWAKAMAQTLGDATKAYEMIFHRRIQPDWEA